MKLRIALAALALSTAATQATPVQDISQQWAGYWNAKNLRAVMTLYAPAPVFLPTAGDRWEGTPSIRKHFAEALKQFDPRLNLTSVVSGASGNLAYDSGTFDEILAPAKGGKQIHARGNYLFLFVKQRRTGWKILEQTWTQLGSEKL